ncbi:MAG: MarR family winged helix-turn-helix transcriptional regulator [Pseudomonadota bacterium]
MKSTISTSTAGQAWLSVVQTYQLCQKRYEELLEQFGLTLAQFDALIAIDRLGDEALPKNIADSLVVTRGNVTGLLKRLVSAGLIKLRPHPVDGRASIVQLTGSAKNQIHHAKSAARRFIEVQLQPFTDAELESTGKLMQAMHAHLHSMDVHAIATTSEHKTGQTA